MNLFCLNPNSIQLTIYLSQSLTYLYIVFYTVMAGLQMYVTSDIKNNKEQIIDGIRNAANEGASFLVTPEGSLSGCTNNLAKL